MKLQVEFKDHEAKDLKQSAKFYVIAFLILTALLFLIGVCWAETIDVNRLADAIYKAEGGAKTKHPYGILAHYKHTTPRQACINTINHALRDWDGKGDFISFLQKRYAPIGVANDPKNLNSNWYKNVRRIYDMPKMQER